MELLEFIKTNPDIVETAKNCKSQEDLHKLIVENNINIKNISENELFQILKESQKQEKQVEDELLENVAGGVSNEKQRKAIDYAKEKIDPSVRKGNLSDGISHDQLLDRCMSGDSFEKYYYDENNKLYYRLK